MKDYLSGKKLYGDDFSINQIERWYLEESEGYADLGSDNLANYTYNYHNLNSRYAFSKLSNAKFENVLGFGSAYGFEFEPIVDKIGSITIVEPSEKLISNKIGHLTPKYVKPAIDGKIDSPDNSFDLITCFGTLHHIPNVSFVISEFTRVIKPGGIILLREPVNSMGDWTKPRPGLTKNERGIPPKIFDSIIKSNNLKIVSKNYCLTMTSALQRTIGNFFKKPLHYYKSYLFIDMILSKLFAWNFYYHPTKMSQRIGPTSIFYLLQK